MKLVNSLQKNPKKQRGSCFNVTDAVEKWRKTLPFKYLVCYISKTFHILSLFFFLFTYYSLILVSQLNLHKIYHN